MSNGLENWSRRVLEAEARKRGIRDPEARSHLALVRLIMRHDYAATRGTRRMIGKLLSGAAAKLPIIGSEWSQPTAADARRVQPVSTVERRSARRPEETPGQVAKTQDDVVSEPAVPGERNTGNGVLQTSEPRATIAALEAPQLLETSTSAVPQPERELDPPPTAASEALTPSAADDNLLDHTRNEPCALHLRWRVSEQGTARARALLGAPGELALRIVSVHADAAYAVHSEVTDHGPIESVGEWTAQLTTPETHCVTSIGLRSANRFVSIVHGSSRP